MSLKVLIIPDKFKGTLTAQAAAQAIERGWNKIRPADTLELIPMSDGGDGFGEVMGHLLGATVQTVQTLDAAHRPCCTDWYWDAKSKTAIIESAKVIGLAMLPPKVFHPFQLDTFGLGTVLEAAAKAGATRCLVGIGGSATNDAGFGMARALGWQFLTDQGLPIESWTDLKQLHRIAPPRRRRLFSRLKVAMDVQNPLLGMRGASRVYGPQKGLKPEDFALAEACLRRLALVMKKQLGKDVASLPGAGAAGGLGFALMGFLGAEPAPGFALFARQAGLLQRIKSADLIISGEGAIDRSTLMGKGVGEVAQLCLKLNRPCLGLAGTVVDPAKAEKLFAIARGLTDMTSEEKAKAKPAYWLEKLAADTARELASLT